MAKVLDVLHLTEISLNRAFRKLDQSRPDEGSKPSFGHVVFEIIQEEQYPK
jgi:hypothetical protein